ncbi:DNA-directed RNA polymerase subunit delta [Haloplasma contractile]|uniref:RNAP delta factor n=1 Tax=Haloplasma contractile SSD-17B TaxID=1033810 RepID=F7PT29_9MOLU|nr:DNA-directed RNA polymerase subunit delta [Haloplasma contractile]ERJ12559.1 putative DNA-directed RNA polymerase subunit delta protein [Haloplasma contractile SSD-17B]
MKQKNYDNKSMIEVAELLMQRKKTPQKFDKIAQEVSELMGLSSEEFVARKSRLYADITLSGKFVSVGSGTWDLKNRQKFELGDYHLAIEDDDEEEEEDYDYDDDSEDDN